MPVVLMSFALLWIVLTFGGRWAMLRAYRLLMIIRAREDHTSVAMVAKHTPQYFSTILSRLTWPIVFPIFGIIFFTSSRSKRRRVLADAVLGALTLQSESMRWTMQRLNRMQRAVIRWTVINDANEGIESHE